MTVPIIPSAEDITERQRALLPPGDAWIWTEIGEKLLASFSPEHIRFREEINTFLVDILPTTTINLFEEWAASAGFPDECSDALTTPDRDDILLRLRGSGAESVAEYEAFFHNSTVLEFFLSRVDQMEVDDELIDDDDWQHTWVLQVPEESGIIFATVDETQVDDPIEDSTSTFGCLAASEFSAHHFVFIEFVSLFLFEDGEEFLFEDGELFIFE